MDRLGSLTAEEGKCQQRHRVNQVVEHGSAETREEGFGDASTQYMRTERSEGDGEKTADRGSNAPTRPGLPALGGWRCRVSHTIAFRGHLPILGHTGQAGDIEAPEILSA